MPSISAILRPAATALALFLISSYAQPAQAQGPGNGGPQPGATTVPIDGGVSLLLAAGAAYGLKRLRKAQPR